MPSQSRLTACQLISAPRAPFGGCASKRACGRSPRWRARQVFYKGKKQDKSLLFCGDYKWEIAAIYSGPVPQQPPRTDAPLSLQAFIMAANSSGVWA